MQWFLPRIASRTLPGTLWPLLSGVPRDASLRLQQAPRGVRREFGAGCARVAGVDALRIARESLGAALRGHLLRKGLTDDHLEVPRVKRGGWCLWARLSGFSELQEEYKGMCHLPKRLRPCYSSRVTWVTQRLPASWMLSRACSSIRAGSTTSSAARSLMQHGPAVRFESQRRGWVEGILQS